MFQIRPFALLAVAGTLCAAPESGFAQTDSGESAHSSLQSLIPDDVQLPPSLFDTIDRLTTEMGLALREGDTRVVWLVDRSASLQQRREQIAQMIPAMVRAAGRMGSHDLETVVVAYGASSDVFLDLQPTRSDIALQRLASALREMPEDETGKENVFSALIRTAKTFAGKTGNPLTKEALFFVLTDEPGDDPERLEEAIGRLNVCGVRCSIAGHVTPFLSERHFVRWTYDDGFSEEIPIDAGRETALPHRVLDLPLSPVDPREIPSVFGPWALSRLCAETGGSYLGDGSEYEVRFDDADLRKYAPETGRPFADFVADIQADAAKQALVNAARLEYPNSWPAPPLVFSSANGHAIGRLVADARSAAAAAEFHLGNIEEQLQSIDDGRNAFQSPRWQADYDLSTARVRAARVRLRAYSLKLAAMQANPKPLDAGKTEWRLVPGQIDDDNQNLQADSRQAVADLQRVIDTHPGTPWSAVAERELAAPLGWEWQQAMRGSDSD